ncbi:hypothetical protein H6G97_35490 [Nostoc flagelliforme FACHB-838]|uniref:Uncharacterized protein n=1 Tax=Nostoc flagelliforme FACHB-838 TaxID=2692904 RepID=A0ABR8E068_9NOSO|nr:hypothetical protein [Nostoc flagelliforme]MBD2534507.1 hypothetical protein [Nostoc flagelliforme FACHB-838]
MTKASTVEQQVQAAVLKKLLIPNQSRIKVNFYKTKVIGDYAYLQWSQGEAGGAATATSLINDGIPPTIANRFLETSASRQTDNSEIQTSIIFDEGEAFLSVADKNVNAYFYNTQRRDYHIAKMFETTSFMCEKNMVYPGIFWHYYANNGRAKLGSVNISCKLAKQVVEAYKVRSPEPTTIGFPQEESGTLIKKNYRIGILNTDYDSNKKRRWIKFVETFTKAFRQ